jgi:hypothetical protein
MSTIEVILVLPEELVEDARRMDLLSSETIAELLQTEFERRRSELEDEAAWEEAVLTQALGDALDADGHIDFENLDARTLNVTLDALCYRADT